jgi:hypothetical protein
MVNLSHLLIHFTTQEQVFSSRHRSQIMKKHFIAFVTIISLLSFGSPAIAGSFADGYGETLKEAMESALETANEAIRSRGEGCISEYNGNIFHNLSKQNIGGTEIWYIQAHYSHHAGSCNQDSRDEKWLREQVNKLGF